MFKLQPNPTFWASVGLPVPGAAKPVSVEIEFRWLGKAALKTFFESLEGHDDATLLAEIVVGWRGIDAEFSRDNLAALLDAYPAAAMAIFQAFQHESLDAKAKN